MPSNHADPLPAEDIADTGDQPKAIADHDDIATSWCIVNIEQLNNFFTDQPCPECCETKLNIRRGGTDVRKGFAYPVILACSHCTFCKTIMSSSRNTDGGYVVNDITTLFFNQVGLSCTAQD